VKKPFVIISFATLFILIYHLAPYIGVSDEFVIGMFILSPFILLYMVYVILKFGKPSEFTFDEKFYDDTDHECTGD
jgi:hypothetical protein